MHSNYDIGLKLLAKFETEDHSMIEDFHEATKLTTVPDPAFLRSVNAFLHAPSVRYLSARAWKEYAGFERIALPRTTLGEMSLEQALAARRSMSNVKGPAGPRINFVEMAEILQHSYGVTSELREKNDIFPPLPLRATCSAGGLYPLEIYPVVLNVDGLASGVYHYSVIDHSLELLRQEDVSACYPDFASQQAMCQSANVIFLITAVMRRTLSKYKHRGYRFIMNDAGALCQSLYLTSAALGVSCSAWGGFCDDQAGEYLGIDNVDEVALLGFVVGAHCA